MLPSKYITLFYGIGRGLAKRLSGNGTLANLGGGLGAGSAFFYYLAAFFYDFDSNCI